MAYGQHRSPRRPTPPRSPRCAADMSHLFAAVMIRHLRVAGLIYHIDDPSGIYSFAQPRVWLKLIELLADFYRASASALCLGAPQSPPSSPP